MHQVSIENITSNKNTFTKHNIPTIPPMTIARNRYWQGSPKDKGKGTPSPTTRCNIEQCSFRSGEIYSTLSNSAPLEECAQKMTAADKNEVAYTH